jgi:PAS domain S-box-containing protein
MPKNDKNKEHNDSLEDSFGLVKEAIIVVDEQARVSYWNPAAEKTFGYSREEALGKDIHGLLVPHSLCREGKERIDLSVKTFAQTGMGYFTVGNVELVARRKDDSEFPAELSISPALRNGKWSAVAVVKNITERKRLQTKLAEYSQKLEELVQQRTLQLEIAQSELVKSERLAAIGELAGMVGHDLRNPLTGIKNSAYFLKKKGDSISQTQAQEMLETIDKCVDYSNKIVNDLLEYSRDVHLQLQDHSPKKLLIESLSLIGIPQKIEVQNLLTDNPKVKVDADKIKRVFVNLAKNAFDAMQSGGKIIVDSKQVNGNLEISFSDNGEGIPEDVSPKLFSPLFTTKAQGMGFGLAICKRIVGAHNGTIAVKSVRGRGTTLTLTLPIELKLEVKEFE